MENWQLLQRQNLPLKYKIKYSERRIKDWYDRNDGKVYVAFSGGKDSLVLLSLVRSLYSEVPAVFVDTGIEYPEITDFVKTVPNVIVLKPKKSFFKIVEEYGYPVISKKISMGIDRYRNTQSEEQKKLRLFGGINPTSGKKQHPTITKKWHFLLDAPFKISDRCCYFLKKAPLKSYEKSTGKKAFIGVLADESAVRKIQYLKTGCNPKTGNASIPIAFWLEKDIWDYISLYNLKYSEIYNLGEKRTGCMFCLFGIHLEKKPNRIDRLKKSHPNFYKLGCKKLDIERKINFILGGKMEEKFWRTESCSSISTFQSCRKKYYFRYIEKIEKKIDSEALKKGRDVHEEIEKGDYKSLEGKRAEKIIGKRKKGRKNFLGAPILLGKRPYIEVREAQFALTSDFEITDYDDKDALFRGRIDFCKIYLNKKKYEQSKGEFFLADLIEEIDLVDWKTGKSLGVHGQLNRYSLFFFALFGSGITVTCQNINLTTEKKSRIWKVTKKDVERLQNSLKASIVKIRQCEDFYCSPGHPWPCDYCDYREECKKEKGKKEDEFVDNSSLNLLPGFENLGE